MVGPWNVLGPKIVLETDGALGWGIVQSVRAVGLLAMSFVAIKLIFRTPLRDGQLWGLLGAAPLFALAWADDVWVISLAAFVGGIGMAVGGVTWDTALQSNIPKNQISRVAAYDDLLSFVAIPVSQVGVGFLASVADSRDVCLWAGIFCLLARMIPLLSRTVRAFSI